MRKPLTSALVIAMAIVTAGVAESGTDSLRLASIFGNNMVLQQEMPIRVWGWARPGSRVQVTLAGNVAQAVPTDDGSWSVTLPALRAGGPHRLEVTDGTDTLRCENVLIGEVWLCSGQSNMEMPLQGWPPRDTLLNSEQEIANANYPEIRLFHVEHKISLRPLDHCTGSWVECTPKTAASFSAAAYFFGRELYRRLGVPIGLIQSTWGGTPAESWVSAESLRAFPEFATVISSFDTLEQAQNRLERWLEALPSIDLSTVDESVFWSRYEHEDANFAGLDSVGPEWITVQVPGAWERGPLGQFDGVVWFWRKANVPSEWAGKDLLLSLGPIDDMDRTYFNGVRVGGYEQMGYWGTPRRYRIPADLVRPGENVLAVRVIDTRGDGGLYGRPEELFLAVLTDSTRRIPLAGEWRAWPVAEIYDGRLHLFSELRNWNSRPSVPARLGSKTPTVLFNGMIHPLIGYGIRGVIWYQGESNVGRAEQYKLLFPTLIRDWRSRWGLGPFPFYFVQIAPYDYGNNLSPYLREAQLYTYRHVENTGIVVTVDIGDPHNIHPANKQEVGRRLALWAPWGTYGDKDVLPSGPLYREMRIEGGRARIFFDFVGSELVVRGDELRGFEIAGPDSVFYPAHAKVEGLTVVVWHPRVERPVAVRYGWSDAPETNLFNSAGLPASPFRTDDW